MSAIKIKFNAKMEMLAGTKGVSQKEVFDMVGQIKLMVEDRLLNDPMFQLFTIEVEADMEDFDRGQ